MSLTENQFEVCEGIIHELTGSSNLLEIFISYLSIIRPKKTWNTQIIWIYLFIFSNHMELFGHFKLISHSHFKYQCMEKGGQKILQK